MQLAEMNQDQPNEEAAEVGLEANMDSAPMHPDSVEGESLAVVAANEADFADAESGDEGSNAGEVWEFTLGEASVVHEVKAVQKSDDGTTPVTQSPLGTFQTMASFLFLQGVGLTDLPNVEGVGIGVHLTIKSWQVRYPAQVGQQSAARCFGALKKGWVPPCRALLQCLLWCWETHLKENPSCPVSFGKVQLLKGAIKADLGKNVD